MMAFEGIFIILYTAFSFHVIMFAIEVVLSLVILLDLLLEIVTGSDYFRQEAKKFMNYIAVTYASAHFFLTATTVIALTFFPDFLILVGQVLFYPLGFIIAVLIIRLVAIAYFWYGWDRLPKRLHFAVGIIFVLAGLIWVWLDSVLLGFMNYSKGLISVNPLKVNHGQLFLNPTSFPLFLLLVFGAIATTCGFLIFYYGRRIISRKEIVMPDSSYRYRLFQYYNYIGFSSALLFAGSLIWYLSSLKKYAIYKYHNWMGSIFGLSTSNVDLSWFFIGFLLVVLVLVVNWSIIVYRVYNCEYHDELITDNNKWQFLVIGPLLVVIFEMLILLNFISQSPYFILSPFRDQVTGMSADLAVNPYADIIDMYTLSIFGFGPLLIAFCVLLYYLFTGRIGGDFTFDGKTAAEL